jgi:regulator of sigma E protease
VVIVIIVTVHEYGHYIVGRLCGIRAEVFSIGFGKPIWSRVDKRGTRWQVALLPLGGYVRFMGDADAASRPGDLPEGLTAEERRHTMQGAPLWARSATVLAGPAFNIALTLIVFFGLVLYGGVEVERATIGHLQTLPTGPVPLQVGDTILSLNGTKTPDLETLGSVAKDLRDAESVSYVVERAGKIVKFDGPNPVPALVQSVAMNSAAEEAGVKPGDLILKVGDKMIAGFDQMPKLVEAAAGKPVDLTLKRGTETLNLTLTPRRVDLPNAAGGFDTRWMIGIAGSMLFDAERRTPGLIEAAGISVERSWYMAKTNLNGIWQILKGTISSCNLSGPVGMAKVASAAVQSGLEAFIGTLALMSLTIGIANLLPIPVLDGGHLVFHVYEAVFRRPPNERVMQVLMTAGLAILLSLMVFAFSNDLFLCA